MVCGFLGSSGSGGGHPKNTKKSLSEGPFEKTFWRPFCVHLGGHEGGQICYLYVGKFTKGASGGLRERFLRGSKKGLNIECSWKRFLIDFGSIFGCPGREKRWFRIGPASILALRAILR